RQFGRVRPRDQVNNAQQVKKAFIAHPLATFHHFAAHHRDMGGGTSEGRKAQTQKQCRNFGKRTALLFFLSLHSRVTTARISGTLLSIRGETSMVTME